MDSQNTLRIELIEDENIHDETTNLKHILCLLRDLFLKRMFEYMGIQSKIAFRIHDIFIEIKSWIMNLDNDNNSISIRSDIIKEILLNRKLYKSVFIKRRNETRDNVNQYIRTFDLYWRKLLKVSENILKEHLNQSQNQNQSIQIEEIY